MIVPIFNSMARIDPSLIEAAVDGGAGRWQVIWNVVLPLSKTGIALGSIFVVDAGDGRLLRRQRDERRPERLGHVGDLQQIATSQYPPAAASAVILLIIVC